jgi:5'-3' exonuclease
MLGKDNEIVCITGDEDYYQLLDDHISIFNGGKQKTITKSEWMKEYGITPQQWVDVGALMGDNGDNIFGVYGVGEKTALGLIQEHGSWEKVLDFLHKQLDSLRVQYPDLTNPDEFKRLGMMKTDPDNPKSKLKYPEITLNTPFTGVALAFEDKKIKKLSKTNLMILMFEERVKLAYSLKKMDIIPDLPEIKQGEFNKERLIEYFDYYDIATLKTGIDIFKS